LQFINCSAGLVYTNSGPLVFGTVSSERMRIDSSGNVGIGTGTTSNVRLTSSAATGSWAGTFYANSGGASTTGLNVYGLSFGGNYSGGSAEVNIVYGSAGAGLDFSSYNGTTVTPRMRLDSSGNLLVGTTSSLARLTVVSSTADVTSKGVQVNNSAGTELLAIRSEGAFFTGGAAASPYNSTTASAANVFIASTGQLQRSTSSIKYKTAVNDATHGLADLLALRPVTYKGKSKSDGEKIFGGLIAEEVHEAGLTEFVQYADDGSPDALAYGNMVSLCIKAIQQQQALIQNLTTRLTALEAI
jgi:hypothetical protein